MENRIVTVMIFENDPSQFHTLRENLQVGFGTDEVRILWCKDGREVRDQDGKYIESLLDQHLKEGYVDLVVVDLKMGERTREFKEYGGIAILSRIFSIPKRCRSVIAASAWKVELPKDHPEGYGLLQKWEQEEGLIAIDKRPAGERENPLLRQIIASRRGRRVLPTQVERQILFVSRTDDPVLILGESGSGKEGTARAIHNAWRQHKRGSVNGEFFSLNAGALQYELIRAELFGYARGSFSGALASGSAGVALQARGVNAWREAEGQRSLDDTTNFQNTLFFDEIGNLDLPCQGLLLRFLERPFAAAPLGHPEIHNVRPRIIAATNSQDWMKLATGAQDLNGKVRSDLFERVARHIPWVPPLYPADVDSLIRIQRSVSWTDGAIGRTADLVGEGEIRGNIRGLINVIKRAELLVAQQDLGWESWAPLTDSLLPGGRPQGVSDTAAQASVSGLDRTEAGPRDPASQTRPKAKTAGEMNMASCELTDHSPVGEAKR